MIHVKGHDDLINQVMQHRCVVSDSHLLVLKMFTLFLSVRNLNWSYILHFLHCQRVFSPPQKTHFFSITHTKIYPFREPWVFFALLTVHLKYLLPKNE